MTALKAKSLQYLMISLNTEILEILETKLERAMMEKEMGVTPEEITKEWFKKTVEGKQFRVKFHKKDGSIKEMVGTTSLELIPEEFRPKPKERTPEEIQVLKEREEASPYINVFELGGEKQGWKKLDPKKLISLEFPCVEKS